MSVTGRPSDDDIAAPVFIVSTGRAGSTMLARVLDCHPRVHATHEPSPLLNTTAFARWKGTQSASSVRSELEETRSPLIRQAEANGQIYVESSHFCSHLIEDLRQCYNARFIHLYRDGRAFVRSGREREWWYPQSYGDVWHRSAKGGFVEIEIYRRLRRLLGADIGFSWDDHRLEPPASLGTRLEKISWLWAEINRSILDQLDSLAASAYTSVALEDFSASSVRRLLQFVGVECGSDRIEDMVQTGQRRPNHTKDRTIPPFDEWPDAEQSTFWHIAGSMMHRLGYATG